MAEKNGSTLPAGVKLPSAKQQWLFAAACSICNGLEPGHLKFRQETMQMYNTMAAKNITCVKIA